MKSIGKKTIAFVIEDRSIIKLIGECVYYAGIILGIISCKRVENNSRIIGHFNYYCIIK